MQNVSAVVDLFPATAIIPLADVILDLDYLLTMDVKVLRCITQHCIK